VVVHRVDATLVIRADLELELGDLHERARMEHQHAPQVRPGLDLQHEPLRAALVRGRVGDDAKDVAPEPGLEL
jgi:hypothetical protein